MINVSKIVRTGLITLLYLFSFQLSLHPAALSVDGSEFKIIQAKINDKNSFKVNFDRMNDLLKQVSSKVEEQAKAYKNTNYIQSGKDLEIARNALANAKTSNNSNDLKRAKLFMDKAMESIKNAQLNLMPSRVVEARGLYLDADSIPTTKPEISKLIKEIKQANFNIIYPEVFRRGYSLIPNPVAETDQLFKNVNFDILAYIIQEAHNLGMEVHPWVWVYRVKSPLYGDSFLKKYPNLIARKKNYAFEDREPLFLSPASPMSKALVLKLLKFVATNYNIDGLLMDYIRYDETLGDDILTKQYFRDYFMNKYHTKPPENIKPGDKYFTEWQLWREDQITQTVKMIKWELSAIRPGIKIGAAIFRTEKEGRLLKMQDWRLWANNQLIKYVCPMLYTDNTKDLNDWLNSETDGNTRNDYLYPSLGAHRFYTNDDIYPLEGLLNQRNIPGFNIFSIIHFGRENLGELAKGIFRKPAYIPHRGTFTAIKLILSDTSQWLKRLGNAEKELPNNELMNMAYQFDILYKSLPDANNYPEYIKLKEKLEKLRITVDSSNKLGKFPAIFLNDIKHQLDYCLKLLAIYTREETTKGKVFTSTQPPVR
jgi:uncharacterized lipoprotein YddW (UPF0748 family)